MADVEKDLQRHEKQARADYSFFKRNVIVALIIVALGCAWGIWQDNQLSKARRADNCWVNYNSNVVLRALINKSIAESPKSQQKKAHKFVVQFYRLTPLQHCGGSNPNPPNSKVLKLAGVKHKH